MPTSSHQWLLSLMLPEVSSSHSELMVSGPSVAAMCDVVVCVNVLYVQILYLRTFEAVSLHPGLAITTSQNAVGTSPESHLLWPSECQGEGTLCVE